MLGHKGIMLQLSCLYAIDRDERSHFLDHHCHKALVCYHLPPSHELNALKEDLRTLWIFGRLDILRLSRGNFMLTDTVPIRGSMSESLWAWNPSLPKWLTVWSFLAVGSYFRVVQRVLPKICRFPHLRPNASLVWLWNDVYTLSKRKPPILASGVYLDRIYYIIPYKKNTDVASFRQRSLSVLQAHWLGKNVQMRPTGTSDCHDHLWR